MLVFEYNVLNKNLLETFGEITWKYKIDELMDKLFDLLNEINNKEGYVTTVMSTNLTNELFETLKILENCTSCKGNTRIYYVFHKSINEVENLFAELEKEKE